MKERKNNNSQLTTQESGYKGFVQYIKRYAKTCRQSYLRLLSI
ncbi:hypothetical protein SAMN05660703_0136 [Cellulophaga tyrosinoxydans]|uniref:Uncharacterized protein n=1 Tax=Cellulophaga tyrosinoxydans TaxID=504486 RepID=A0A1W1Y8K3_9FLAO|nr:hypothetical protein SAMN05660703_0136 [Cellulophaga tyrosinoxydans]